MTPPLCRPAAAGAVYQSGRSPTSGHSANPNTPRTQPATSSAAADTNTLELRTRSDESVRRPVIQRSRGSVRLTHARHIRFALLGSQKPLVTASPGKGEEHVPSIVISRRTATTGCGDTSPPHTRSRSPFPAGRMVRMTPRRSEDCQDRRSTRWKRQPQQAVSPTFSAIGSSSHAGPSYRSGRRPLGSHPWRMTRRRAGGSRVPAGPPTGGRAN